MKPSTRYFQLQAKRKSSILTSAEKTELQAISKKMLDELLNKNKDVFVRLKNI